MKSWIGYAIAIVIIVAIGIYFWTTGRPASTAGEPSGAATTAETGGSPAATSTTGGAAAQPLGGGLYPFSLRGGDTVVSWSFKGVATGDAEATKHATGEIARLKTLAPSKDIGQYELDISIANQYHWLGDGTNELLYLRKALAIDSQNTGLAWSNLGVLLEQVGAYHTARIAYQNAVSAQAVPQYISALNDFIAAHPGS